MPRSLPLRPEACDRVPKRSTRRRQSMQFIQRRTVAFPFDPPGVRNQEIVIRIPIELRPLPTAYAVFDRQVMQTQPVPQQRLRWGPAISRRSTGACPLCPSCALPGTRPLLRPAVPRARHSHASHSNAPLPPQADLSSQRQALLPQSQPYPASLRPLSPFRKEQRTKHNKAPTPQSHHACKKPRRFGTGGAFFVFMGLGRVELPTSRLSGVRSNHLSYRPLSLQL